MMPFYWALLFFFFFFFFFFFHDTASIPLFSGMSLGNLTLIIFVDGR